MHRLAWVYEDKSKLSADLFGEDDANIAKAMEELARIHNRLGFGLKRVSEVWLHRYDGQFVYRWRSRELGLADKANALIEQCTAN